jgi:aflatoxin B1 aldehyde reductase
MYDRPEVHTVMNEFMQICERNGMTSTEASLRWIMHHSALSEGDGVILGATRIDQLESSVNICKNGALPEEVLRAVEDLWEKTRGLMENFTYEPGSHK